MTDRIEVFFENLKVAQVEEDRGRPVLRYEKAWIGRRAAFPVSLSMPLSQEMYADKKIMPWLANLLPESHLHEIGQMMGVHAQDVLGILSRMGRDTAGALSVGQARGKDGGDLKVESEGDLEKVIDQLPSRPLLVGTDGVSMSLAGAQNKIGVTLVDGKVCIPVNGTPSTHILKPDNPRLKGSVQNEAFCVTLAALCGLDAAKVTTGKAGKRSYLLVERYDRMVDARGTVRRIHQEDLAQIMGYFPVQKYETPPHGSMVGPGPGLKAMFKTVADHVSPGERLRLLDGVIFNVLTCNTDAHAKNYSVMIGAGGSARLAPLYDILCGEVWPSVTKKLAQKVGGRTEAVHIHAADWRKLAEDAGLNPSATLRRVSQLCVMVREHASTAKARVEAMPAGGNHVLDSVLHQVLKRVRKIESQLGPVPVVEARPVSDREDEPAAGPCP